MKDLRYQLSLLTEIWPDVLKGYANSAKALEQFLGEDHNLAVLADILEPANRGDRGFRTRIAKKQTELREKARQLGSRLLGTGRNFRAPPPVELESLAIRKFPIGYAQEMDALREHVLNLLAGKGAHVDFDEAVADFPPELRGKLVPPAPHTAWQLLEHIRIAQWDIVEFSRNPEHVSPKWPQGYWPETAMPPDPQAWDKSVRGFHHDMAAMRKLISDTKVDLLARIPGGEGQTLLREALVLADHNAYHLGQFVFLRKMLGAWKS